MKIPTTPGARGRVRPRILVATAVAALTAALAATSAQAAPPPDPDPPRTYRVTADLAGRFYPKKSEVYEEEFLRKGQRVEIECQEYGGPAYGSKLWDLVSSGSATLYVPDAFIKTGTSGIAPQIGRCTIFHEAKHPYVTDPFD